MKPVLAAIIGFVLIAGTGVGVAASVRDTSERAPAGQSDTSEVVLYGDR